MQIVGLLYDDAEGAISELTSHEEMHLNSNFGNLQVKVDPINKNGLDLIKHFESVHDGNKKKANLQPQMDPIGIWTVGYGHALRHNGGGFLRGERDRSFAEAHKYANLTLDEATALLKEDISATYMPLVLRMVDESKFNDDQLAALCSFAYNCGTHYRNKQGRNVPFAIWNNAQTWPMKELKTYWENSVVRGGGRVLPGLVRRRKAEFHLFANGVNKFVF